MVAGRSRVGGLKPLMLTLQCLERFVLGLDRDSELDDGKTLLAIDGVVLPFETIDNAVLLLDLGVQLFDALLFALVVVD